MTKDELIKKLYDFKDAKIFMKDILTAVDAYSSASNNGKPLVRGSLPLIECEHYSSKTNSSFFCPVCDKMIGGNDR